MCLPTAAANFVPSGLSRSRHGSTWRTSAANLTRAPDNIPTAVTAAVIAVQKILDGDSTAGGVVPSYRRDGGVSGEVAGRRCTKRPNAASSRPNYARLAGWVRRQVDDDETAHDIAAEAFTRLLSRWPNSYDPHAYLYKVAVNLLRDHWRRASRERRVLSLVAADQRDGPDGRPERGGDLRGILAPLPEHQRTALLLHYLAGFSVREVSAIVGRPEGTVKSDLFHARARIRADLDGTDE